MRYYVATDLHGFYDEFMTALDKQGFFSDTSPHRLLICGDLFDRGLQALKLQDFLLEQHAAGQLILIRGNHEDLMLDLLRTWSEGSYRQAHHRSNGTTDTVLQLTSATAEDLEQNPADIKERLEKTPFLQTLLPSMLDYYETPHYIFVHGWIPCTAPKRYSVRRDYFYLQGWRDGGPNSWKTARWVNGMEAAHGGATEPGKTIVCGHINCSFGHACYEGRGVEFGRGADFSPYRADGIIALDACTAFSERVNCIVIED